MEPGDNGARASRPASTLIRCHPESSLSSPKRHESKRRTHAFAPSTPAASARTTVPA
jgi:hypothetical protein